MEVLLLPVLRVAGITDTFLTAIYIQLLSDHIVIYKFKGGSIIRRHLNAFDYSSHKVTVKACFFIHQGGEQFICHIIKIINR